MGSDAFDPRIRATIDVQEFAIGPDSRRVAFVPDALGGDVFRLYVAPIDGSAPAAEASHALGPFEDVRTFWIDTRSRLVAYRAGTGLDAL